MLLYFVFLIAEAAYNMLYFMLLETAGALVAGVLQGLRAVCVFAFSSVFFCKNQHSQCFNVFKGFSTLIVIGGVGVYAFLSYIEDKRAAIDALTAPVDSPAGLEADSVGSSGKPRSTAIEFADSAPSAAASAGVHANANSVAASARPVLYQLGRAAQQEHMQLQPPQPQRVLSALPPPTGADGSVAGRAVFTPLPPPPAALVSSALASSLASSISQKSPSWTANTPLTAAGAAADAGSVPALVDAAASNANQNGNQSHDAAALGAGLVQAVADAPLSLSS